MAVDWLVKIAKWIIGRAGDFDFVWSQMNAPTWTKTVLEFFQNSPLWLSPLLVVIGFIILFLDRKFRDKITSRSAGMGSTEQSYPPTQTWNIQNATIYTHVNGDRRAEINDPVKPDLNIPLTAFIDFDASGDLKIYDSLNVSGIVDSGIGDFTVYFDVDFKVPPIISKVLVDADVQWRIESKSASNVRFRLSGREPDRIRIEFEEPPNL